MLASGTDVVDALRQVAVAKSVLNETEIASIFFVELHDMKKAPDPFSPRRSFYESKNTFPISYISMKIISPHRSWGKKCGPRQFIEIRLSEGHLVTPSAVSKGMSLVYRPAIKMVHVQEGLGMSAGFTGYRKAMKGGPQFYLSSLGVNGFLELIGKDLGPDSPVSTIWIDKFLSARPTHPRRLRELLAACALPRHAAAIERCRPTPAIRIPVIKTRACKMIAQSNFLWTKRVFSPSSYTI